mgnify:CR=1 FL=1
MMQSTVIVFCLILNQWSTRKVCNLYGERKKEQRPIKRLTAICMLNSETAKMRKEMFKDKPRRRPPRKRYGPRPALPNPRQQKEMIQDMENSLHNYERASPKKKRVDRDHLLNSLSEVVEHLYKVYQSGQTEPTLMALFRDVLSKAGKTVMELLPSALPTLMALL